MPDPSVCIADPSQRRTVARAVCEPDVRISARQYGNICRLLNHSENPNTALRPVVHEEVIHLVAMTTEAVEAGAQLLVDYGGPYWRAFDRHKCAL
eukprot:6260838-Prymnesium_polylepis.2